MQNIENGLRVHRFDPHLNITKPFIRVNKRLGLLRVKTIAIEEEVLQVNVALWDLYILDIKIIDALSCLQN